IGVLLFSFVLEAMSFRAAWGGVREAKKDKLLVTWARTTGDVDLLVVTFEDLAALVGLSLALTSLLVAHFTGDTAYDAVGSIAVGAVLLVVAVFVGAQIRRLIVGQAVDDEKQTKIRGIWKEHGFETFHLIAVWTGPHRIMVAIKV